jgi:Tol biopolymer transport system component
VTETIPYGTQTQSDTTLLPGERRLLQAGRNGLLATNYRLTYEDGQLINRVEIGQEIITTPVPEIARVGLKDNFTTVPLSGTLVYLSNNNAFMIREVSGNKRNLTTEGDLDGHVLSLSPDGRWLLYTRANSDTLNSLWYLDTLLAQPEPKSLAINGVLWADFSPDGKSIAYSRADPAPGLPGFKALNDLSILPFNNGKPGKAKEILKPSSNAQYAWWGTTYRWSPDSRLIAYANTEEIGVISPTARLTRTVPITDFAAYNTRSTWAWTPAIDWSPDGKFLAATLHVPSPTGESDEDSPAFDVAELEISGTLQARLISGVGMWAAPQWLARSTDDVRLIFGLAETPYASDTSRYTLHIMDRDGSNRQILFPTGTAVPIDGLPDYAVASDGSGVAVVYQGDLYLINFNNGLTRRMTADGSISSPRWK